jgi:hypothetical protein
MAALAPATYTRLVEGRRLWRDSSKSLTTSLIGLACALTRFSFSQGTQRKIMLGENGLSLQLAASLYHVKTSLFE